MTQREFDDVAFTIELAFRGVGYRHRGRRKPYLTEMEAHCASIEIAQDLREKWEIRPKPRKDVWSVVANQGMGFKG